MPFYSVLLILFVPFFGWGQTQFVSFLPEASVLNVSQHSPELELVFAVTTPYHVQADRHQLRDPYLIPTHLVLDDLDGVWVCRMNYSPALSLTLSEAQQTQVLPSKFSVHIPLEITKGLKPGSYPLTGKLFYQACDHRKCFFPRELEFAFSLVYRKE